MDGHGDLDDNDDDHVHLAHARRSQGEERGPSVSTHSSLAKALSARARKSSSDPMALTLVWCFQAITSALQLVFFNKDVCSAIGGCV